MNPAGRFVSFAIVSAVASATFGRSVSPQPPAGLQRFGPLVVVSFAEDAPDPVAFRDDLLSGNRDWRIRALRAMGIDSSPEVHDLWAAFLNDHSGQSDDKSLMQFISGGMLEWNFGEPGSKQAVLGAGFDELTDRPLEFSAVFNLRDGRWRHVATVACRCQMTDDAEPLNLHPGRPDPPQEWKVTFHSPNERINEDHRTGIRFRLHNDRLWPLIQFESGSTLCPSGFKPDAVCDIATSYLEKAILLDPSGNHMQGYVVITWDGSELLGSKGVRPLKNPRCAAYTWDEASFAYLPSPLEPLACGQPGIGSPKPLPGPGKHLSADTWSAARQRE